MYVGTLVDVAFYPSAIKGLRGTVITRRTTSVFMRGQVKQISLWLGLYHRTLFWQVLDITSGCLVCFYVGVDIFQDECRKTCLKKYPCYVQM